MLLFIKRIAFPPLLSLPAFPVSSRYCIFHYLLLMYSRFLPNRTSSPYIANISEPSSSVPGKLWITARSRRRKKGQRLRQLQLVEGGSFCQFFSNPLRLGLFIRELLITFRLISLFEVTTSLGYHTIIPVFGTSPDVSLREIFLRFPSWLLVSIKLAWLLFPFRLDGGKFQPSFYISMCNSEHRKY